MNIQHIKLVIHGVLAAFISASLMSLSAVVVSRDMSFADLGKIAVMGGIIGTAGYFTKSPVQASTKEDQ